ncbi:MAG: tRNA (adenosine(37)-N6)-threonylcarbamoyltransferase complex transferase subunit TsaD, partial [Planctomycetota bacterium]
LAASFQRAAVTAVLRKLERALERHDVRALLVGGGVTANARLREELAGLADRHRLELRLPPIEYCLDNAAMIAGLAALRLDAGRVDDWTLSAAPRSSLATAGSG